MRTRIGGIGLIGLGILLLVVLTFVKIQSDKEGAFLCEVVEKSPELTMDDCPAHDNPTSWLILLAFAISFVIIAGGAYLVWTPAVKKEENPKAHKKDISTLDEEEQKVYKLVHAKEGSAYQSDLIKELNVSKVRMSRILDRLEGKGMVERKRRGMTNIVVLK